MRHLLEDIQTGRTWTGERPGRAAIDEIPRQIEQIKMLLTELEKLLQSAAVN